MSRAGPGPARRAKNVTHATPVRPKRFTEDQMLSHNSFWHKISHSIRAFFRRKRVETELDSELRFHLEARIEASIRTGMSPETARQSALREFGGVELAKEECRDERGTRFFEHLWQDVRFGLRM